MHTKTRPQQPHVQIPSSSTSRQTAPTLSPTPWVPQITDHSSSDSPLTATPYSQGYRASLYSSPEPLNNNTHLHPNNGTAPRPISFSESLHDADAASWRFPEPNLHRSISHPKSGLRPVQPQIHRFSKSDSGNEFNTLARVPSFSSSRGSITPEESVEDLSHELSSMTLESEEGLNQFQAGLLNPVDEAWHRLVPETAREALGKREVERQSVIFEVFKSEKDYVADLEAVRDVFIEPLKNSSVIRRDHVLDFVREVFWNIDEIIAIHQRMLPSLFARQREQHPLVQSVTDIILETALQFQPAYESYIKHYPLAEARHRSELRSNPQYQEFVQEKTRDPRIKKRDLVTFISRPVTRLPRLSLVLEHIEKYTDPDHPDMETMPILLGILTDFIKSTQPGIAAAESKVKYWSLCEGLVFRKGEIIDMDLYHENRTLVHSGSLARKQRNDTDWHGWNDIFVALLNNYLILTKSETLSSGVVKYHLTSRPIPLQYLRLGSFDQPLENRKEKADDGKMLESLRYRVRPVYPFTIYHAAAKSSRRYTLYTNSEAARTKWRDALVDALGVHKAWQEGNEWFAPMSLNDDFFRIRTASVSFSFNDKCTGALTAATAFISAGKKYLAVACQTGIYVGNRGPSFKRVLKIQNATSIFALQNHNKFLVHHDNALLSYSLDLLARVSQGLAPSHALDASMEKIAGQDGAVICVRAGPIMNRMIVVYVCKSFLSTTVHALEVINPSQTPSTLQRNATGSISYRSFGNPFYVPKQAFDITFLTKTVGIATEKGIVNVDPMNLSSAAILIVPDFSGAGSDEKIAALKNRCDEAKPLGLARSDHDDILVIYEDFGCYVTRHGIPCRHSRFIRWEIKAYGYAHRGSHVLLFSSEFIEVRHISSGKLVQVLEGQDIRMLHPGPSAGGPVLAARRGSKNDRLGLSDEVFELVETAEIATPATNSNVEGLWDEWDM